MQVECLQFHDSYFWTFSFQIADISQLLAVEVLTSDKREIQPSPGWPLFFKHSHTHEFLQ
jgi:hypothetical protein